MPASLPRITGVPRFLRAFADAFNTAMEQLEARTNLTSNDGSVTITQADLNTDLSASGDGGGIPDGYEERAVILCDGGTPVSGTILFKPD